jgi:hypothetical protein
MPQHLWHEMQFLRICEVCSAFQTTAAGDWLPSVGPICYGDDDEGGGGRRRSRPKPPAPSGAPRVLEVA